MKMIRADGSLYAKPNHVRQFLDCLTFNPQQCIAGLIHTGIGVFIGYLLWAV